MTLIKPIPFSKDLGASFDIKNKDARNQYSLVLSETCSIVDRIFEDNSSLQKTTFAADKVREFKFYEDDVWDGELEPHEVIHHYEPLIEEHIERRVQFFFYQLIACYKTGLHFESTGALDQGKSSEKIFQKVQTSKSFETKALVQRNACHSASNPCLIAFSKKDAETHKEDVLEKGSGVIYLKDTDYYRIMNATISMPRWINMADREIDEKNKKGLGFQISLLRTHAQDLINTVAQGALSPDKAIITYMFLLKQQVENGLRRLKEADPEKLVLTLYHKYTTLIQEYLVSKPKAFEALLNIAITSEIQSFKDIVFELRYETIRNNFISQASLMNKIDKVAQTFLSKGRKMDHFTAALRTLIILKASCFLDCYDGLDEDAVEDQMLLNRQRLSKLLNFSVPNFRAQLAPVSKAKFKTTLEAIEEEGEIVESLSEDLIVSMQELRKHERDNLLKIINSLLKSKKWDETEFDKRIKAMDERLSLGVISKEEVDLDEKALKALSSVFETSSTLFAPKFYYS
jgi:hypothetical protein